MTSGSQAEPAVTRCAPTLQGWLRRQWLGAGLALWLAGCAGMAPTPGVRVPHHLLDDAAFAADRFDADPARIMALSPEMRRYLAQQVAQTVRERGSLYGLVHALNDDSHLRVVYDAATHDAHQTFVRGSGNCLSLVVMTAAFARELGLEMRFQRVLTEDVEVAVEGAGLVRRVAHVNMGLARRGTAHVRDWITVDFLPPPDAAKLRVEPISARRVEAMFLNNKAVEALVAGERGLAYWWARASAFHDPDFAGAYVTLGVLWSREQRPELARQALLHALRLDPGNASGRHNLAQMKPAAQHGSTRGSGLHQAANQDDKLRRLKEAKAADSRPAAGGF